MVTSPLTPQAVSVGTTNPPTEITKVQFNVYLPKDLVREIKHAAVDDGDTLSAATERALRAYLESRG